jgi:hypothetical protein
MNLKRLSAATAALTVGLLTPLGADAESAERSYSISTRIIEQAPSVGEYDGSLRLRITPDGIISGYYRPDDNPRFISVSGGVTGQNFWLEIGTFASTPVRFSGTFNNGKIAADSNRPITDDGRYTALELIGNPKQT